jgi:hypothetical protein
MKPAPHRNNLCAATLFLCALAMIAAPQHVLAGPNLNNFMPQRSLDHMVQGTPEASDEEGELPLAGPQQAAMSDEEFQSYISSPHSWFRSTGSGKPSGKPIALDSFAKVLSDDDQTTYREIFKKIGEGKHSEAMAMEAQVKDKILMGHVEAAMLLSASKPDYARLAAWMKNYNDLPEARDIYNKALKAKKSGDLTKPAPFSRMGGNIERAEGSGTIEWNTKSLGAAMPDKQRNALLKLTNNKNKLEEAAAELAKQKPFLNEEAQTSANLVLAEALMWRGAFEKSYALIKGRDLSKLADNAYAHWIAGLVAWGMNDYTASYKYFSALAAKEDLAAPNRAAAAFWGARAAKSANLTQEAKRLKEIAFKYPRSFYGILARTGTSTPPEYNWTIPGFNAEQANLIKQQTAGRRALALLQVDEVTLAQTELCNMPGKDGVRPGLLALANRYSLPSLSLQVGNSSNQPRRDAALYPLMPWSPNGGYASDPALVLAVAKNESRFEHEARSPAGAMGVMQVMPATAEHIKQGTSQRLYDPEMNVTLGDRYLEMLTRTDGVKDNLLLIIGSYNWGPDRVVRYYQATQQRNMTDPLLFIEAMPVKETRDYIRKVMATYWVYRARFNKPLTAMVELAVGRWPRYKADSNIKLTEK